MIPPTRFRDFFWPLLGSFFFAWMFLVVVPWCEVGHLPPIIRDYS